MVVRWEAASCWWVTVWAWRLRTCPLEGDAIRYPHLCRPYIHMPPLMQRRPVSIAELPVFWSLCQVVWANVLHVWMENVDLLDYDHWEKPPLHKMTLCFLKNHWLACSSKVDNVLIKKLSLKHLKCTQIFIFHHNTVLRNLSIWMWSVHPNYERTFLFIPVVPNNWDRLHFVKLNEWNSLIL